MQTWRTIRAAALTLSEERGFDAVTIDEIAAAANVARGTFFNYFESKEAVVVAYGPHEAEVQRSLIASSVHIPCGGSNRRGGDRQMPGARRTALKTKPRISVAS